MTTGEQLRDRGLDAAASRYKEDLAKAQRIAELWALGGRVVNSDEVRELFLAAEGRELSIGSAMGALFRLGTWEYAGRVKSKRKSAHARWINCWRLAEKIEP